MEIKLRPAEACFLYFFGIQNKRLSRGAKIIPQFISKENHLQNIGKERRQ
jgi:hypothetical protein